MTRRNTFFFYLYRIFIFGITASIFLSCGQKIEGWGVMLWSLDEDSIPTGSIVAIYQTSSLRSTYTIGLPEDGSMLELPQWRIEHFKKKKQAEQYVSQYAEYVDRYAVSQLNGLRLREEPEQSAAELYKLREGQAIKVLERQEDSVKIGDYIGYWYKVLTEDGMAGFVFGHYLDIKSKEQLEGGQNVQDQDPFLTKFLNSNFRPVLFREMIEEDRLDLRKFISDYGIFPDPENNKIVISAQGHTSIIEYESISVVDPLTYAFEGSTLLMIKKPEDEVNLVYSDGGVPYSEDYVYLNADMDMITIQELERRRLLFESIVSMSSVLSSAVYGTIALEEPMRFSWEGYDRLVPDIIPAGTGNTGTVDFNLYLAEAIEPEYDGSLCFIFDDAPVESNSPAEIAFLYTFQDNGIRFRYVPLSLINENIISSDGSAPLIIFFSYDN